MAAQRVIFHLDMDAFYASVEQRDEPSLRGQPVIVGGRPNQRGVVCAASYEARKFGVRSAMPCATAARLCPGGIFVPPRMNHYRVESDAIMAILARRARLIEQMSIDEAYLDVSEEVAAPEWTARFRVPGLEAGGAVALARDLKAAIFRERGLTATIGIGPNKLLAKLASGFRKPDGLTLIPDRDKRLFLRSLPVQVIYGVGRVTEQTLRNAGVETVGDLQDYPGDLRALVGSFGAVLRQFAVGEDDRPLELGEEIKSISSEETFDRDTSDRAVLRGMLREAAAEISEKLRRRGLAARTVQVKVRYGDFTTLSRQITVEEPLAEAEDIYRLGCFLLGRDRLVSRPLRLLGLGVSGLGEPAGRQLRLL